MDLTARVQAVIDRAEQELAAIAAEAAAARDYAGATAVLSLAQRVAAAPAAADQHLRPPQAQPGPAADADDTDADVSSAAADRSPYPRFKREGTTLVKVGWSKVEGRPYQHRTDKRALRQLTEKIRHLAQHGSRFTTEQLLPLHDEHGQELPTYQPYMGLAWLTSIGVLIKEGRQGYTLATPIGEFDDAIEKAWRAMGR